MHQSAIPAIDGERFLPVPDFPRYHTSDQGRVWSSFSGGGHFLKWVMYGPPHSKYPGVTLSNGPIRWRIKIHQLVMLVFVGPCPQGMEVLHEDGDKLRPWLNNLSYGTHRQNGEDMIRHGSAKAGAPKGQDRSMAKLTDEIVRQARIEYAAGGVTQRVLAARYGVDVATIHHMLARNTWRHVA